MTEAVDAQELEAHTAGRPLFGERSMIRRVNRESVILLGGSRALLMQIAHPLVAAGVAEHSRFEDDRLGRLLRTLHATYALVFGSPEQAAHTAAHVNALHARVTGPGYAARDPELLLWVHATLVDSALLSYSRFLRPLTREERCGYFEDCNRVAALLGLPRRLIPRDLDAFEAYLQSTVAGLEVSDDARRIARALFGMTPLRDLPLVVPARLLAAGLLPPRLRRQFGLGWGPARAAALEATATVSRAVVPSLPRGLRRPPPSLVPRGVTVR